MVCFAVNLPPGVQGWRVGRVDSPPCGHPVSDPCLCSPRLGGHQLSCRSTSIPFLGVHNPQLHCQGCKDSSKGFSYHPPVFLGALNFTLSTQGVPPFPGSPQCCAFPLGWGWDEASKGWERSTTSRQVVLLRHPMLGARAPHSPYTHWDGAMRAHWWGVGACCCTGD